MQDKSRAASTPAFSAASAPIHTAATSCVASIMPSHAVFPGASMPPTLPSKGPGARAAIIPGVAAGAALAAGFRARHGAPSTPNGLGSPPISTSVSSFPTDGGGFLRASDVPSTGTDRGRGGAPAGTGSHNLSTARAPDALPQQSESRSGSGPDPTEMRMARAGADAGAGDDGATGVEAADDDSALFGPGGDPYRGLAHEQAAVLRLVRGGRSLFFTGPAGAGKSHVLRRAIRMLVWMHTPVEEGGGGGFHAGGGDEWAGREGHEGRGQERVPTSASAAFSDVIETDPSILVAVTASTGIAACNVGGRTLHSWAGLGRGEDPLDSLIAKIAPRRGRQPKRGTAAYRMTHARALVVDEVSMLDGQLLDKLDHLLRAVRSSPRPMGGLQVLLCGDFFQLPPTGLGQGAGGRATGSSASSSSSSSDRGGGSGGRGRGRDRGNGKGRGMGKG